MKTKQNAILTILLRATYEDNSNINVIYCNYYKVILNAKGRVWARNHRDLEFICLIAMEVLLTKHNSYNKKYLFINIELSQEEGPAYMTNPKTICNLHNADLKCIYNNEFICYWRSHPYHNGIIIS